VGTVDGMAGTVDGMAGTVDGMVVMEVGEDMAAEAGMAAAETFPWPFHTAAHISL
jgi:hypothetical protein